MILNIAAVLSVFVIRTIPILISLLLVADKKNKFSFKNLLFMGIVTSINLIVFECVHILFRGYANFFATINYIYTLDFSYQELVYFPISFAVCYCIAVIIGKGVNQLQKKEKNSHISLLISHSAVGVFTLTLCCSAYSGQEKIVISEVCSNNQTVYLGDVQIDDYCDYVEIRNEGIFSYDIEQLWLSDDRNNLQKLSIENRRIQAGECLVIGLGEENATFSVSSEGEWIFLSDDRGNVIDEIYSVAQREDVSYSRINEEWNLMKCSPGIANEYAESLLMVNEPLLSYESGFYTSPFYLELSADENLDIYFSLDGSIPNEESMKYTEAVYVYDRSAEANVWNSVQNVVEEWKDYEVKEEPVSKAFVIRAVAIDKEGNRSDVVTATYFVGVNYADRHVISLVADPNELFGEDGIYVTGKAYDEWYLSGATGEKPEVNYLKRGRGSEVATTMELFKNESLFQQNVGLRIMGGSTRDRAKKRFTITARKEYSGTKWFDYNFLEKDDVHSIAIREGLVDAFSQDLVKDRAVAVRKAVPTVVYLNGEYWYTSYIRERFTEEMLGSEYDVPEDNILIIEEGIVKDGNGSKDLLEKEIYAFIDSHDLSNDLSYAEFCEIVDIQSYIDYCCINLYLCNVDCNERKNCIMWRTKDIGEGEYEDKRWRWTVYDMDAMEWGYYEHYGVKTTAEKNNFAINGPFIPTSITRSKMFLGLKDNPEFCRQFVLTFMDMINTNFSEEAVNEVLGEWGLDMSWNDSFFENRKSYAIKYLIEELELDGGLGQIHISINKNQGGSVAVNTIVPEFADLKWHGEYVIDYPLTVHAVPAEGYKFVGWEGDVISDEETINIVLNEEGSNIHAVFEKVD